MGFRTVVMLNNDRSHEWSKDPELGSKIQRAMNFAGNPRAVRDGYERFDEIGPGYGRAVECVHADTVTLVKLGHYTSFEPLAYGGYQLFHTPDEGKLEMLKRAAEELGYHVRKKPVRKPRLPRTK